MKFLVLLPIIAILIYFIIKKSSELYKRRFKRNDSRYIYYEKTAYNI